MQRQRIALVQARYRSDITGLGELLKARQALLTRELDESHAARQLVQDWSAIRYLIPEENKLCAAPNRAGVGRYGAEHTP